MSRSAWTFRAPGTLWRVRRVSPPVEQIAAWPSLGAERIPLELEMPRRPFSDLRLGADHPSSRRERSTRREQRAFGLATALAGVFLRGLLPVTAAGCGHADATSPALVEAERSSGAAEPAVRTELSPARPVSGNAPFDTSLGGSIEKIGALSASGPSADPARLGDPEPAPAPRASCRFRPPPGSECSGASR